MSGINISVCLACHNGEQFLYDQIHSIVIQLNENDELLISLDNNTDNSKRIIASFGDRRIKVFEVSFGSVIRNFEYLLGLASGNYIFLSDQDDVWKPAKVRVCMDYLTRHELVISDAEVVNQELKTLSESFFRLNNSKKGLYRNLFLRNSYMGCTMAFTKKVLEIALPFPEKIPMHDLWLGLVGELFFDPLFIHQKLILYRRHALNVSQSGFQSKFSTFNKILFRINTLRYLPTLFFRRFFR